MTKCRILLGVCFVLGVKSTGDAAVPRADLRIARVEAFFRGFGCLQPYRARDYVLAADAYQIDFRLLPALSVRETLCGKGARLNNYWGWGSARIGFVSVETGIVHLARQLARGKYYRGKSLEQKLHAYNHRLRYAMEVKLLMNRME